MSKGRLAPPRLPVVLSHLLLGTLLPYGSTESENQRFWEIVGKTAKSDPTFRGTGAG